MSTGSTKGHDKSNIGNINAFLITELLHVKRAERKTETKGKDEVMSSIHEIQGMSIRRKSDFLRIFELLVGCTGGKTGPGPIILFRHISGTPGGRS
jgi:hypothetical protein